MRMELKIEIEINFNVEISMKAISALWHSLKKCIYVLDKPLQGKKIEYKISS